MALSKLLLAAGATVLVAAIGWWWTTFGDVVAYGYLSWTEAGRCLVRDSDICALAKMLCLGSHPKSSRGLLDKRVLARPRHRLDQSAYTANTQRGAR
jgi:hypothetical protein